MYKTADIARSYTETTGVSPRVTAAAGTGWAEYFDGMDKQLADIGSIDDRFPIFDEKVSA